MHEKVRRFLEESRLKEAQRAERERAGRLRRLNLVEDQRQRVYSENTYITEEYPYKDPETGKFYKTALEPVEVSDEEYAEICKYDIEEKPSEKPSGAVTTARVIAGITLIAGLIAGFFLAVYSLSEEEYLLLLTAAAIVFSSLLTWALIRIFCEIAQSLRNIERKIEM